MSHSASISVGAEGEEEEEKTESDWAEAGEWAVLWQLVNERAEGMGWWGVACKVGVLMGAAWRHASLPLPLGLVVLSCQMKSCN